MNEDRFDLAWSWLNGRPSRASRAQPRPNVRWKEPGRGCANSTQICASR